MPFSDISDISKCQHFKRACVFCLDLILHLYCVAYDTCVNKDGRRVDKRKE